MIVVADASVAVKWFLRGALREEHETAALDILRASGEGATVLLQPPHFLAEVAAVLARLDAARALRSIGRLAALDIEWAEPTRSYARALALARELDHPLFDTLYHALTLDTVDAVLVTADRRYFDKAHRLGGIAWLGEFRVA